MKRKKHHFQISNLFDLIHERRKVDSHGMFIGRLWRIKLDNKIDMFMLLCIYIIFKEKKIK